MKIVVGPNAIGLERVVGQLQREFPQHEVILAQQPELFRQELADADILWGSCNRAEFLAAPKLRWVQAPSTGVNGFMAIPEFVAGDVLLSNASGTHGNSLADHTMALILAHTRGLTTSFRRQQEHAWASRELRNYLLELTDATLGIVGFGVIGRTIAKRAAAFDMRILAVDIIRGQVPAYVKRLDSLEELPAMLAESDYVAVTVPYTPDTLGLIGERELAQIKPGAFLVGVSRGGVIDEDALVAALRSGHLVGAALDVCAVEPLPAESELWDAPNLIITPHTAGGSQFELERLYATFTANIRRFERGELPLINQIDKVRGF
ncbi:MAG: D-2-hydroxyacid dehydrogenase [Chloroflexi bacterium]|nr:D-2-hydroxyacid dehydrogenase [Chloroflexota bacterium]